MKAILLTAVIALFAPSMQRGRAGEPATPLTGTQTGNGVIRGIIQWPEAKQPLEGIPVTLQKSDAPGRPTQSTTTDSEGRFAFRNLTVGSYNITAEREGYTARIPFGLRAFATPATAQVLLTETESVADLRMSLIPGGAFTGRVIDADGRPAANVNVRALQNRYGKIVTISRNAITNDRGEYRVWGLFAGDYYLHAEPRTRANDVPALLPTYFPSASTIRTAVPLTLKAQAEMLADITLQRAAPIKITGRVVLPDANVQGQARFYLANEDVAVEGTAGLIAANVLNLRGAGGAGDFQIWAKGPGTYSLFYLFQGSSNAPEAYTAQTPLEIRTSDVTGVVLTASRTTGLDVRFNTGGDAALERQIPARLTLTLKDASSPFGSLAQVASSLGQPSTRPQNAGNTGGPVVQTFMRVSEGEYVLTSPIRFYDGYIADIRQRAESILNEGVIRVGKEPPPPVEIIVKRPGATIQGTVRNAAGQPLTASVVLIPDGVRRQNPVLYERSFANQGQFSMRGLAPGRYKLFAWDSTPGGAEELPEFIKQYERFGREVNLTPGTALTDIALTVIDGESK